MRYEKRDDELVIGFTPVEVEDIVARKEFIGYGLLAHIKDEDARTGMLDLTEVPAWLREEAAVTA